METVRRTGRVARVTSSDPVPCPSRTGVFGTLSPWSPPPSTSCGTARSTTPTASSTGASPATACPSAVRRWRAASRSTCRGPARAPPRDVVAVVASPLQRAQETATPIAEAFGLELAHRRPPHRGRQPLRGHDVRRRRRLAAPPRHWRYLCNPFRPSWGEPYTEQVDRMRAAVDDARGAPAGTRSCSSATSCPSGSRGSRSRAVACGTTRAGGSARSRR